MEQISMPQSQNELTADAVINILNSRTVVSRPGSYKARVTSVHPYIRKPKNGESEGRTILIVNTDLMNNYQVERAVALIQSGNFQEGVNQSLSSSVRPEKDYIPKKGEIVKVYIDQVPVKDGKGNALLITNLSEMPLEKGEKINFTETLEQINNVENDVMDMDVMDSFMNESSQDERQYQNKTQQ